MPETPTAPIGTIELEDLLGMRLRLSITSLDHAHALRRSYGQKGFSPGPVPSGGYTLPYAMANTFDWACIGAREFEYDTTKKGKPFRQKAVIHRGLVYNRRDCAAEERGGISYPNMVKYSRGAKTTDADEIKEGHAGKINYVTLVTFRGNGKAIPEFERRG